MRNRETLRKIWIVMSIVMIAALLLLTMVPAFT